MPVYISFAIDLSEVDCHLHQRKIPENTLNFKNELENSLNGSLIILQKKNVLNKFFLIS